MKYIECAGSPARTITCAGFRHLRAQQLHDVGDGGGVELGKQRHARDHAPGDDEVAAVDLLGESGGDDADRQRDHDEAADDGAGGDQLAERGDRHHVAIADGAERDDRPPQRLGNGAELVGLHVALGEMHERGGDQRDAERDHQAAEQRAPLAVEHVEQRAHGRRIARDLEEAHDAEHQHARAGRPAARSANQNGSTAMRSTRPAGLSAYFSRARVGREMRGAARARPRPTGASAYSAREHDEREDFDDVEPECVARVERRHRLQRHRHQIDQDERDQRAVDHAR